MNQTRLRILLQLLLFLIKTRQLGNVLKLALWVIKEKIEYDEVMARLYDPDYWDKKVKKAAQDYLDKQPKEDVIKIPGYRQYLESMKGGESK